MKTEVIYTGVDESDFKPRINVHSTRDEYFRVIFRGKYNDEAGLEVLAEATRILKSEKIKFLILSKIRDSSLIFSANTQIIEDYFPNKSDIASLLAECDLSLGQLSSHDRLKRTIPHKAFESAYLGIPYLTARNPGILEIFEEGIEVFCFEPGSPISLAKQIRYLRENRQLLKVSSENLRTRYIGNFTQAKLSEKLLFELNS
jgi:glycosyltransferase involved in cell wall biosynthesis